MNTQAKKEVNAFERTLAASHSFVGKLVRAKEIIAGYRGFITKIESELELVQAMIDQHEKLDLEHEGNVLRERYQKPLLAEAEQLRNMVKSSQDILKEVDSGNKVRRLTEQRFKVISEKINDLLFEERGRRISSLRVMGPMVLTLTKTLEQSSLSSGALAEAYVLLVEQIARSQLDRHSQLTNIDAWFQKETNHDYAIWLYHHSEDEKWKCLFFKLRISRIAEDLKLTLEAYVPFGLGADPANYELESSDVYARAGWRLTEALTKGLNQSRSLNLNESSSIALGKTQGDSVTQTDGTSTTIGKSVTTSETSGTSKAQATSVGESQGTSHTKGSSVGHSSSWFDNWSESAGYSSNWGSSSQGTNFGGGSSNNQGRGGGQSTGTTKTDSVSDAETFTNTITDTTTLGDNQSTTKADGTTSTEGSSSSTGVTKQTGSSDTRTKTKAVGITMGDGESIQIAYRAFGIALGKPTAQHLEKWREANGDASRVYDSVVSAFDSWVTRIGSVLKTMSRGGGMIGSGRLEDRLLEIGKYVPLEYKTLADVTVHRPGGAVEAIADVVKPLPRHGTFGLEHLAPPPPEHTPDRHAGESSPVLPALPMDPMSELPDLL